MDVGLVTVFVGGALALLSPCAALLLPAFFASTLGTGPRLLLHCGVFYLGLLVLLIPLGLGSGVLGAAFVDHRQAIVTTSAAALVVLGTAQALGYGFDPARLIPGAESLQSAAASRAGLAKSFLLGVTGGVAGFCAGPILGAVLTLAAAQGDALSGALLLAIYGAGMVLPLLLISASWRRIGSRGQRLLRGRELNVLGRSLHTTSLLTGGLIVAVGVLFWTTNGLVGAPELVPLDTQSWLQQQAARLADPTVDIAVIVVITVAALGGWSWRRRVTASTSEATTTQEPPERTHR